MKEFKVAIIQHDITEPDKEYKTKLAIKYIKEAKANGADCR